jgi:hypothetical protein
MAQTPTSNGKSEAMKSDAQKLDYASLISETKTFIDRLEQMLISCDRQDLMQTHPKTLRLSEEWYIKHDAARERLESTTIKDYEDCHKRKDFEFLDKAKDVLLSEVESVISELRLKKSGIKTKQLKHQCSEVLKKYLTESDEFLRDRDENCLKYQGK